jgi:starch synthase
MKTGREVVFIAAENGALRGGKVGGIADVVRDLPAALSDLRWQVSVVTPAYGLLHKLPGSERIGSVAVDFAGQTERVDIWQVPGSFPGVRNVVLDHELFAKYGVGKIYFGDQPDRPYATDASKFAFLCAAVATWLNDAKALPDVVHLHDWHAAIYCLLRNFSDVHQRLRTVRTVFTIHNLSYQGTRPLAGDPSSLEAWFPDLEYDADLLRDPEITHCLNPMATAIRLADRISTVSPTYAAEICQPSNAATSFIGGEGLEGLLQDARREARLVGILNGCYYDTPPEPLEWPELLAAMRAQVDIWADAQPLHPAHALAATRLDALGSDRPATILTSVGRLVAQKATLFEAHGSQGKPALEEIAAHAGKQALLLILGSGEPQFEKAILDIAVRNSNLLFLCGYSETLADHLYSMGDLFLMPSSFEPCGISQMLAMRAGTPCVVHGVGGLRDTVQDEIDGFVFAGDDLTAQADAFVATTSRALDLRRTRADAWNRICSVARSRRFEWGQSAQETAGNLYEMSND